MGFPLAFGVKQPQGGFRLQSDNFPTCQSRIDAQAGPELDAAIVGCRCLRVDEIVRLVSRPPELREGRIELRNPAPAVSSLSPLLRIVSSN